MGKGIPVLSPSEKGLFEHFRRRKWPYAFISGEGAFLAGLPGEKAWKALLGSRRKSAEPVAWPRGKWGASFPLSAGGWLVAGPFKSGKDSPDRMFMDLVGNQLNDAAALAEVLFHTRHQLEAVLRLGRAFSSIKDLKELVSQRIVQEMVQLLNADRGTVYLIDHDSSELFSIVATGSELKEIRFPMDKGLAGYVAKTGKILNIRDAYEDDRFNPDFDRKTGYRTRSVLVIPMDDHKGKRLGVVQVINKKPSGRFSREDEQMLVVLAMEAATAIVNVQLVEELKRLFEGTISAMATAMDARDNMTAGHSHRVTQYAIGIAKYMGMSWRDQDRVRIAGLLHDMGKIGTPDAVLKKPSGLTPEEYETIKLHAPNTKTILGKLKFPLELEGVPDDASGHHEWVDGSGYPNGLKGEGIPLVARILAVADVFDAVTSRRHYRDAMPIEQALDVIRKGSGTHFWPPCVEAFLRYFEAELRARFEKGMEGDSRDFVNRKGGNN